jgi:hypothetical protein
MDGLDHGAGGPGAGDQGLRRHTALGEQVLQLVNVIGHQRKPFEEGTCGAARRSSGSPSLNEMSIGDHVRAVRSGRDQLAELTD